MQSDKAGRSRVERSRPRSLLSWEMLHQRDVCRIGQRDYFQNAIAAYAMKASLRLRIRRMSV